LTGKGVPNRQTHGYVFTGGSRKGWRGGKGGGKMAPFSPGKPHERTRKAILYGTNKVGEAVNSEG